MRNAVSLLPERYKLENQRTSTLSNVIRVVTIVLVCLVVLAVLTFVGKTTLNLKLNSLTKQNDEAQATILQNSTYEKLLNEKNNIAKKINAVRKLDKHWTTSIFDISSVLPDGVGFESLSSSFEGNTLSFSLECSANTLDDISKTLTALLDSPAVTSATCTSTRISNNEVKFSLAVTLSGVSASEAQGGAE